MNRCRDSTGNRLAHCRPNQPVRSWEGEDSNLGLPGIQSFILYFASNALVCPLSVRFDARIPEKLDLGFVDELLIPVYSEISLSLLA